jgi:hypothetical protein
MANALFRGFTFTNGIFIPSTESTGGPQCASTTTEGEFVFNQCDVAKNSQRRTVRVGTSTYTTQLAWTSIREETFQFGPTTTVMWTSRIWTFFLVSTITTTAQRDAVTVAPAIQLVWRPGDLLLAQQPGPAATSSDSNSSPASSQEPPLGKGAIAGIAVGAVVFAAMAILGIFMYIRRRRRKPSDVLDAPIETTESPSAATAAAAVGRGGGLEPGQKAELDATSAAIKLKGALMEKQELPADSVVPLAPADPEPQRFELDATPVMRELPTTEEAMPGRDQTPPSVPAARDSTPNIPVSPVSDRSSRQAGLSVNSPPSVLSSVGGNDRYTAEGWRASILEE